MFVLLSDVPASAMYFASYEVIMRLLVPAGGSTSDLNMMNTIFAGKYSNSRKKKFIREMPLENITSSFHKFFYGGI